MDNIFDSEEVKEAIRQGIELELPVIKATLATLYCRTTIPGKAEQKYLDQKKAQAEDERFVLKSIMKHKKISLYLLRDECSFLLQSEISRAIERLLTVEKIDKHLVGEEYVFFLYDDIQTRKEFSITNKKEKPNV
jgi:hypothetical protein